MQQEIKAVAYVECSALEGTGLSDLTDSMQFQFLYM